MNSFPSISEQSRPKELFEPLVHDFTPRIEDGPSFGLYPYNPANPNNSRNRSNPMFGPDRTPDFSERIDIEADSIGLALSTLNMSKAEYNAMSISQLKDLRRIDFQAGNIYAINILIHYKQNSRNLSFPQINPFQHNFIESKINSYKKEKAHVKIYPEMN